MALIYQISNSQNSILRTTNYPKRYSLAVALEITICSASSLECCLKLQMSWPSEWLISNLTAS